MEPVSTVSTALETAGVIAKIRAWWRGWAGGTIKITEPRNRETTDKQPWIPIKGEHTHPKGKFWLLTRRENKFWPQKPITLEHDGMWNSSVNVEEKEDTRPITVVLARVW